MKKIVCLWIFISVISTITAQRALKIVASASMIEDIAAQIAQDDHTVVSIVPIGGDPHLHEPTPSDARLVAAADLILINGLTFEGWINELISNSGTKAKVITVSEGINVLSSQTYQNSADPHAWMDVSNAIIYTENIAKALQSLDPSRSEVYASRSISYIQKLKALDEEILQAISNIPEEKRILITSHDAFQYYGRRYGIKLEAIMGISTEAEVQTADIMRINNVIRKQHVPAIFVESTINPKLIKQLARDNNISIGGELFADSLGDEDSPASTYISMMRYNTNTIVAGLSAAPQETSQQEITTNDYSLYWWIGLSFIVVLAGAVYYIQKQTS